MKSSRQLIRRVGISRRTYFRYKQKLDNGEDLEPKQRDIGPLKFTPEVRRSLGQLLAQDPERSSTELAVKLNERFGITFSARGVRKVLQSMGHVVRQSQPRQLTPGNKQERLVYANNNLHTDWKRLWAYDEVYFNLWKSRHWPRSNKRTNTRRVFSRYTNAQETVSLGFAAAFSHNNKSALCPLPKNWHVPELRQVWEEDLLPSIDWDPTYRRCRAFILDNNGRHHSAVLVDAANLHGLNRNGYLPSNSPDLNPSENIWNIMKRYVLRHHPTTERELRRLIYEAYETITPTILRREFDSLPHRIQAVIDNNGDRTAY